MSKKVYKYGTGDKIPEGAVYLCTKVEQVIIKHGSGASGGDGKGAGGSSGKGGGGSSGGDSSSVRLVWHYFLVN